MSDITSRTATLYGDLWGRLDERAYEDAITESERFYAIPDVDARDKACLDVGCGSGFFVTRLFRAGAGRVTALDISNDCIQQTQHWNRAWADKLTAQVGEFPHLAFPDAAFDYAYSNGVLHHTEDPEAGFRDLCRVTKPGGLTVVGLYGAGGLFPNTLAILRKIVQRIPYAWTSAFMKLIFPHPYNQYRALDYLYVPILRRYTEAQARAWFERQGYTDIVRTNAHERYWKTPWSRLVHGVGYIIISGRKPLVIPTEAAPMN